MQTVEMAFKILSIILASVVATMWNPEVFSHLRFTVKNKREKDIWCESCFETRLKIIQRAFKLTSSSYCITNELMCIFLLSTKESIPRKGCSWHVIEVMLLVLSQQHKDVKKTTQKCLIKHKDCIWCTDVLVATFLVTYSFLIYL